MDVGDDLRSKAEAETNVPFSCHARWDATDVIRECRREEGVLPGDGSDQLYSWAWARCLARSSS